MRSYNRFITAGLGLVTAVTLAACGPDDTAAKPDTGASSKPAATTADNRPDDEGELIDVPTQLVAQGFPSKERVARIAANAKFILLPFATTSELEQSPADDVSCAFEMVNVTYKGTGPIAAHRIRGNSTVKVTMFLLSTRGISDAPLGEAQMHITEVTPQNLSRNAKFQLEACEDDRVR